MTLPLLAIPYIYLTYFEILYTPVRNVVFFVYLFAGAAICAAVLALARIDRTRLSAAGGGHSCRRAWPFSLPCRSTGARAGSSRRLSRRTALGSCCSGLLRPSRTKRVRAVAAAMLCGLLGLVALFPEREAGSAREPRERQMDVRRCPRRSAWRSNSSSRLLRPSRTSNYSQDVNVWNYELADVSQGNIKALVNHPRVVDTNDIDRSNFTVPAQPPEDDHPYFGVTPSRMASVPGLSAVCGNSGI